MADDISQSISETGVPTRDRGRDLEQTKRVLQRWFATALPDRDDFQITEVRLPSSSGVANETLMCEAVWNEGGQRRTGGYVVRVNSPDFLYKDVDLEVHANMYRVLWDEPGVPVPRVVGSESDTSLLGEPFFVMERLEGLVPADTPPFHVTGWVRDLPPADRAVLWQGAVEVMARLHQVDTARLAFLDRPHLGRTGLEQDFAYWLDYRDWAVRGREVPVIDAAVDWLRANAPVSPPPGLAWGDSRMPNVMYRDRRVVAVFDWDMVSLAGAESDLAWWTVMDYTNTEAAGIARLEGIGSPVEMVRRWEELVGRKAENLWFHLVYAAYRLAVILVRLGDLFAEAQTVPKEMSDEMITNNAGIQFLVQMLDLPAPGPVTMRWPGFDA
jgi:aminoglycoside phosphotransferase (APT) family kinase protein